MQTLLKRWWFWVGVVALAVIALAALFVASPSRNSEFQELVDLIERNGICTEPRLWRNNGMFVVKFTPTSQAWSANNISVQVVPDTRTFWERIQDEYRYQKRKRGW
jgi:hypothetical protein